MDEVGKRCAPKSFATSFAQVGGEVLVSDLQNSYGLHMAWLSQQQLLPVGGGPEEEGANAGLGAEPALPVEVRRSARRKKTVSAYRQDGRIVVLLPARCSLAEERRWVETMVARLTASSPKRSRRSDAELARRAAVLSDLYLDGRAKPTSVVWSTRQDRRWGSCTPTTGAIRLSTRLRQVPAWVLDYVLVHELTHLIEADHSPAFWERVAAYPKAERARGFLEGLSYRESEPDPESGQPVGPSVGSSPDGSDEDCGPDW